MHGSGQTLYATLNTYTALGFRRYTTSPDHEPKVVSNVLAFTEIYHDVANLRVGYIFAAVRT